MKNLLAGAKLIVLTIYYFAVMFTFSSLSRMHLYSYPFHAFIYGFLALMTLGIFWYHCYRRYELNKKENRQKTSE